MDVQSGTARVVAAIIALIAWMGLIVQLKASYEQMGSVVASLWIMFLYFTVLSNLLSAVVMTGVALGRPAFRNPFLLGGTTLSILSVGILYSLLLRGLLELSGGAKLADTILHDIVPVLVPLFWLIFAPKGRLRIYYPVLWAIYPLAYAVYALVRGAAEGKYAYPTIDVSKLGMPQTLLHITVIAFGFVVLGMGMIGLDRLLARRASA